MNPIDIMKALAWLGNAIKGAAQWAYNNARLFLELVLVAAILVTGWMYNRKTAELRQAELKAGQLADGLQSQIRLKDGQLEVLRRKADGTVSSETTYVPPEGYITIKETDLKDLRTRYEELLRKLATATDPDEIKRLKAEIDRILGTLKNPTVTVEVKDKGFCLRPGIAMEYGGMGLQLRGDLKLAYWKRYSAEVGGSKYGLDISASRHLDDILWGKPQNLEAWFGYKFLRMNDGNAVAGGLRLGF